MSPLETSHPSKTPTAVFVLGTPCSGGETIARALASGADSMVAIDVSPLNNEVLESAGSTRSDWHAFDPRWLESPMAEHFVEKAILQLTERRARRFVLSDPAICRLLPLWSRILQQLDAEPFAILLVQNPLQAAANLSANEHIPRPEATSLWLRYLVDAEFQTRPISRLWLHHGDLMDDWRTAIMRLNDSLGLAYSEPDETRSAPAHRLDQTPESALLSNGDPLPDWVRDAYAYLLSLCEQRSSATALAGLDAIRSELTRAGQVFGAVTKADRAALDGTRRALADLGKRTLALEQEAARAATLEQALAQKTLLLQQLKDTLTHEREKFDAASAEQGARLEALEQQLARWSAYSRKLEELAGTRANRIWELESALHDLRARQRPSDDGAPSNQGDHT